MRDRAGSRKRPRRPDLDERLLSCAAEHIPIPCCVQSPRSETGKIPHLSQRSKNLLEAFNQSKAPEKSAQPVAQPRGSAPRVGGPFADPTPLARPKAESRPQDSRPSPDDGSRATGSRLRVVLLCSLVALTFFALGRVSAPSVQAAGAPGAPPPGSAAKNSSIAAVDVPARSISEALNDRDNKFTILAISYKLNDDNDRLAKATKERLIQRGFPTALCKNVDKKQIYLLVGAEHKLSDLDALLARIKQLTIEHGKQEFPSANGVPIENYLAR